VTILVEQHYDVEADDCIVLLSQLLPIRFNLGTGARIAAGGTLSIIEHLGLRTRPNPS
jgi:hypothetical protein